MNDPCLSHVHLDGDDGQARPGILGCWRTDAHRLHYDDDHGIWWADVGGLDGEPEHVRNLRHALSEAAAEMDRRYEMGAKAERDRIWSRPVTQHLELHGGRYGPVWRCAGCLAELTESTITHMPRCTEMGDGHA